MTSLQKGDKAPFFEGATHHGTILKSNDFKGKKLIVFFYPKDLTPGCTAEACNIRDHYTELKSLGFEIIGISADPVDMHKKFVAKNRLPFTLISDTERKIVKAFGVWGEKKFMGRTFKGIHRTTFVIDEKGMIMHVINKVDTKNHSAQLIEAIRNT